MGRYRQLLLLFGFELVTSLNFRPRVHTDVPHGARNEDSSHVDDSNGSLTEVVGGGGRMGSLWLREPNSIAVPRGICPGSFSEPHNPIYVAVPSSEWELVHDQTRLGRQADLVYIGNGLLQEFQRSSTVVVPHFGVLKVGSDPVSSPSSPPTFVFGRHASAISAFLTRKGIDVKQAVTWKEISTHAARKLLWASIMWVLCHGDCHSPLNMQQVYAQRSEQLEELVKELLYAISRIIGVPQDLSSTLKYLRDYSLSMPLATPSKHLATMELDDRNYVFLRHETDSHPQTLHRELLCSASGSGGPEKFIVHPKLKQIRISIPQLQLSVYGSKNKTQQSSCPNRVAVIGGGVIGSSVALHLARKGVKEVAVFDMLPDGSFGRTTPASWAWLNANQKSPLSYKWLNQMGMRGWRVDPALNDLPRWTGSLVRTRGSMVEIGGYPMEGPLSPARVSELEPCANFTMDDGTNVYFFPSEGYVEPREAVAQMQISARSLGVEFKANHTVFGLLRNGHGHIVGVQFQNETGCSEELFDVVVVAAGTGAASETLGGLPLTSSPGRIAFAAPSKKKGRSLRRLLVDTVAQSHVLQRHDGTVVAGGGALQVGGNNCGAEKTSHLPGRGAALIKAAQKLAPAVLTGAAYLESVDAVRPMPKDGFPVVGFLEPGLYSVVSHSGMTLAPILGGLAAIELTTGIELEILLHYRPSRFKSS